MYVTVVFYENKETG